eukprot:TRINITY_DN11842_c0_g1_i1.p1 TRINITY_DN11842_c0_g1~~TRINITY_DN11842_c0_g1_i1.p1  ORF type:complete len:931 (-),score=211.02 TRINITY_DN11842_c0_g1_i1:129-2921(-)
MFHFPSRRCSAASPRSAMFSRRCPRQGRLLRRRLPTTSLLLLPAVIVCSVSPVVHAVRANMKGGATLLGEDDGLPSLDSFHSMDSLASDFDEEHGLRRQGSLGSFPSMTSQESELYKDDEDDPEADDEESDSMWALPGEIGGLERFDSLDSEASSGSESDDDEPCADSEEHKGRCVGWMYLCPGSAGNQSLPEELREGQREFMSKHCRLTCGMCQRALPPRGADGADGHFDQSAECSPAIVQRRRRATTCQCRRRVGGRGLPLGWSCGPEDKIVYKQPQVHEGWSCCCKAEACSMQSLYRGDAMQHTREADGQVLCCKAHANTLYHRLLQCPLTSGYNVPALNEQCTRKSVEASRGVCADRLTRWFKLTNWYEALEDWQGGVTYYVEYLPCAQTEDRHVKTVVLGEFDVLRKTATPNPIREIVRSMPECSGLAEDEVLEATRQSYYDLCPFPLPTTSYHPNLHPDFTCSYDPAERRIYLQDEQMCPEGTRCGCPVYSDMDSAMAAGMQASQAYNVAYAGATVVNYASIGAVAAGVATAEVAAPLALVGGATAVVAFGGNFVWKSLTHSCMEKVGCYPIQCVYVKGTGCRIQPVGHLDDARNPFWFMPPPLYKCGYHLGSCRLSACSRDSILEQRVGKYGTESVFSGENETQVYNCQPMLTQDMTALQRKRFADIVRPLTDESALAMEHMAQASEEISRHCPWSRPTAHNYVYKCKDWTSCTSILGGLKSGSCCKDHGGILQCPRDKPVMCKDQVTCDTVESNCQDFGGPRPCKADANCPWLVPSSRADNVECWDGSFCEGDGSGGWGIGRRCCSGEFELGVKRCPVSQPMMCEEKCGGEWCCRSSCDDYGGLRKCEAVLDDEDEDVEDDADGAWYSADSQSPAPTSAPQAEKEKTDSEDDEQWHNASSEEWYDAVGSEEERAKLHGAHRG